MTEPPRGGFALFSALICVVLIGALIAGAFFATTEETRASANSVIRFDALTRAESAIEREIANWTGGRADSLPIGGKVTLSVQADQIATTTWLIRLDSALFWVVAESQTADDGGSHGPSVRRRAGVLVRAGRDTAGNRQVFRLGERSWAELF